jgi:hypothetical protein
VTIFCSASSHKAMMRLNVCIEFSEVSYTLPIFRKPAGSFVWFVRSCPGKKELKGVQADCLPQVLEWIACTHKSRWWLRNVQDCLPEHLTLNLR